MSVQAQFPKEQSKEGEFTRQEDRFHGWVTQDGSSCSAPHLLGDRRLSAMAE